MKGGQDGGGRRQPRKLNPAFMRNNNNNNNINNDSNGNGNNNFRLETILKRARDTGKLLASNIGLQSPLPDELFSFNFNESRYTEELLTVVDFSDNDEFLKDTIIDERILKYKSVQSLRFRNCGFRLPPNNNINNDINNNNTMLSFRTLENLMILDLSGNRLERFDVGLMILSGASSTLVELNLSNNRIREIVATTTMLGDNDDSNNGGDKINVISLPKLRSLDVSHNAPLERLFNYNSDKNENKNSNSSRKFSCENLRIFRCDHNPNLQFQSSTATTINGLPSFLRSATGTLEVFEASHNPKLFTTTCDGDGSIDLTDYVQLQTVSFAMNKLNTAPCIPHSVKRLDLRSNKLTSISGLFPITSKEADFDLVDLILSDNYLTQLDPIVVERMERLQRLDLISNKLTSLPYQLGFLTSISTLSVSGNPVVTKLSSSAVNETNNNRNPQPLLQILRNRAPTDEENDASTGKCIESIRSRASTVASDLLSHALSTKGNNTLDLAGKITNSSSNNSNVNNSVLILEAFVRELLLKPWIASGITGKLILDSNHLKSIPEDLFSSQCLPNVQVISFKENHLTELPTSLQISCSKTVKQLNLGKNQLTTESLVRAMWFQPTSSSSSSSWSLRCLTHLDVSSNRLSSFPIDTACDRHCFPSLQVLNLSNNRINTVHDWSRLPSSLMILDLSENAIEDIEPLVVLLSAYCPEFQRLSLIHNQIKRIPLSIGLLKDYAPRIVSLNLLGNPQFAIRGDRLELPCSELLSYLANRLTSEQRQAAIAKIQKLQEPNREGNENDTENIRVQSVVSVIDSNHREETPVTLINTKKKEHQDQQGGGSSSSCNSNNIDVGADADTDAGIDDADIDDADIDDNKVLDELKHKVEELKIQLENLSLTQAKKYALKKSLAMERSKLIREERRLGLRK
jgi:Leucine-rich repeat (LRR) protein